MIVVQWFLGAALLLLGRKLYWFFVGVVGFVTGLTLAARWLEGRSELLILLVGLALGGLGALLALALQRIAIAAAGFFAGGYIAVALLGMIAAEAPRGSFLPFVLGGVVGVILVTLLFDWALIFLSSLTGAAMIVQGLEVSRLLGALLFAGLLMAGLAAQASLMRRDKRAEASTARPEP